MNARKLFLLLTIAILTLIVLACATIPTAKYQALKDSSQSLLTSTSDTYTRIEKLQRRFVITSAPDKPINRDTFKPIEEGQSYDIVPELLYREAALGVIVKYFAALNSLASKDYMSDVDKASLELSSSVKTLLVTSKKISKEDSAKYAGILATAIDTISRPIIETERIKALRSIMKDSQPDLEKLVSLIKGSNLKIKKYVDEALVGILHHVNNSRPNYGSPQRYDYDKNIAELIDEVVAINSSLEGINSAIEKIPTAHKEIKGDLEKKPTKMEALTSLISEAERINKYYRSLESK